MLLVHPAVYYAIKTKLERKLNSFGHMYWYVYLFVQITLSRKNDSCRTENIKTKIWVGGWHKIRNELETYSQVKCFLYTLKNVLWQVFDKVCSNCAHLVEFSTKRTCFSRLKLYRDVETLAMPVMNSKISASVTLLHLEVSNTQDL